MLEKTILNITRKLRLSAYNSPVVVYALDSVIKIYEKKLKEKELKATENQSGADHLATTPHMRHISKKELDVIIGKVKIVLEYLKNLCQLGIKPDIKGRLEFVPEFDKVMKIFKRKLEAIVSEQKD